MKNILVVIGTRPNFIKVTQFKRIVEEKQLPLNIKIVHTGQHYDAKMADVFFEQFGLQPDYYLQIGSASPNTQMAKIMLGLEDLIENKFKPDLMIVPGDVNSTLAATITANKMGIKLAHLESGLRSDDREMPEEINRILTDEITDYFFITEKSGIENLTKEKKFGKQFLVGNTMIDTLVANENNIQESNIVKDLNITSEFVLMTIHRPSNVDSEEGLNKLIELLKYLDNKISVVFPVHPRTIARLKEFGLHSIIESFKNLTITEPLGYFEFQKLIKDCEFVMTDSGGIQEETTFRQKPCLTLRDNTERPITTEIGTNTLVEFDVDTLKKHIDDILDGDYKEGSIPELWDGKATERILDIINSL